MVAAQPRQAWNLLYETDQGLVLRVDPRQPDRGPAHPGPGGEQRRPSGWTGPDGPAIAPATWPRSPVSGLPMRHVLTLWLPPDYLVRGPELVGVALFQGDTGDDAEQAVPDPASTDPFLVDLAAARPHPHLVTGVPEASALRFALVWLTADEITPGPTPPPTDVRRPGEHTTHGPNAWDAPTPHRRVHLVPREDPNTGVGTGQPGYRTSRDEDGERHAWAAHPLFELANHLGGTYVELDWVPRLGPHFLQLDRSPGLELVTSYARNGILAVDLGSGVFDLTI